MKGFWARLALVGCGLASSLCADVRLPAVISDHMVVQRDQPVHVWGWADSSEPVNAEFRGQTASATADALGRWSVVLPAGEAGGPYTLLVKGKNEITVSDVLVGDIWVGSGQSNMEFKLSQAQNSASEIAAANYPAIRLFTVQRAVSAYPLDDVQAHSWEACTPATAAGFSAVAYFFGRDLNKKLTVPIGLIHSSWGGTPAEAWTSMHGLGSDSSLMPVFTEWAKMADTFAGDLRQRDLEKQEAERAKAEGRKPAQVAWRPNERLSWSPSGLFNAMIAPLTNFPIKGVIWYQGESNADPERAYLYERLFETMIGDWRRAWGEGDFPFLFVQIANFKAANEGAWPVVRDAQRKTLSLRKTGMAVTIDIGNPDNIHPVDKQDVGGRLALAAQAIAYGEHIEYSGPLFREARSFGSNMRLWFDHTGGGLIAKGGDLKSFEVAGADLHFKPAEAHIDGDTVVVSSPDVLDPRYVRYGWSNSPDCNLFNGENLPASPFSSE